MVFPVASIKLLTKNDSIALIGDAAHLMTPFAGVGVNVAMEDSLHLARNIITVKDSWQTGLPAALQKYDADMFVRAEEYAKQTWMYLGLFFHERGGIAMVEHFERARAREAAATAEEEAKTTALPTEAAREESEKGTLETGGPEVHASVLEIPSPVVAGIGQHVE